MQGPATQTVPTGRSLPSSTLQLSSVLTLIIEFWTSSETIQFVFSPWLQAKHGFLSDSATSQNKVHPRCCCHHGFSFSQLCLCHCVSKSRFALSNKGSCLQLRALKNKRQNNTPLNEICWAKGSWEHWGNKSRLERGVNPQKSEFPISASFLLSSLSPRRAAAPAAATALRYGSWCVHSTCGKPHKSLLQKPAAADGSPAFPDCFFIFSLLRMAWVVQ